MYFPILRGGTFELLALRECAEKNLLSDQVLPILEPVKLTQTYIHTIDAFIHADRPLALILNPAVGTWKEDVEREKGSPFYGRILDQLSFRRLIFSFYVTPELRQCLAYARENNRPLDSLILLCMDQKEIPVYRDVIGDQTPMYNVIFDSFKLRIFMRSNRILCEDCFPKKMRNAEYLGIESEFFSLNHLAYAQEGYKGFSDYSIIGKDYSESGFAPCALAIHIVYFDEKNILRVAHFVSDTNDDLSDMPRKFMEAAAKLVRWNERMQLNTAGIRELQEAYQNGRYPGIGALKKYSIMHHLELMSQFLDALK